jgi:hypothetical protein
MGDSHVETAPRARAVGDLPLAALSARAGELTRRWAIALIQARPMEHLGTLELDRLAADGPALARALIAALASEEALAELLAGGPGEAPGVPVLALAAGAGGEQAAELIECLRGAVWELLLDTLGGPMATNSPRTLLEAGDRLAYVCSRLLAGLLGAATEEQRDGARSTG